MMSRVQRWATPLRIAVILVVGVTGLLGSGEDSGSDDPPGPQAVMQQVEAAPLAALAPLTGTTADALVARLRVAGYPEASADSTPQDLADAAAQPVSSVLSTIFGAAT